MNKHGVLAAEQQAKLICERFSESRFETAQNGYSPVRPRIRTQMSDDIDLTLFAGCNLQYLRKSVRVVVVQIPTSHAISFIPQQDAPQGAVTLLPAGKFDQPAQRRVVIVRPEVALRCNFIQAGKHGFGRERFAGQRGYTVSKWTLRKRRDEAVQKVGCAPQSLSHPVRNVSIACEPDRA